MVRNLYLLIGRNFRAIYKHWINNIILHICFVSPHPQCPTNFQRGYIVSKLESFATPEQSLLCSSSFAISLAWPPCSVVNALTTARYHYQPFAVREFKSHRWKAENIFFMWLSQKARWSRAFLLRSPLAGRIQRSRTALRFLSQGLSGGKACPRQPFLFALVWEYTIFQKFPILWVGNFFFGKHILLGNQTKSPVRSNRAFSISKLENNGEGYPFAECEISARP